jgi:sirohydrochlorin cobaltochelatase
MKKKAVVLLLHGSKDPSWIRPFEELRTAIADKAPGTPVAMACLQFCPPTLEEAVSSLARDGIENIVVVPLFISTRGHVAKDVPVLVDKARKRFPAAQISVSRAVGEFPAVHQAMIDGIAAIASGRDK